MLKSVQLSRIFFVLFSVLAVNSTAIAQDYAPGYRVRQQPREMVQQPAPDRRNFFERLFGVKEEPRFANADVYQRSRTSYQVVSRKGARQNDNPYLDPDLNPNASKYMQNGNSIKSNYNAVSMTSSGGLYCVRACDGFFFPIANPSKVTGDASSQQEVCSSLCPSAKMEIYRGSSIEMSVGPNRKSYLAHPKSYAYREKMENTCSCKGDRIGGLAAIPFSRDYTLRSGDIVLMDDGVHQFNGSRNFPYKSKDFALLSQGSSRLSPDLRHMLEAKNVAFGTNNKVQVASASQSILPDVLSQSNHLGLVSAKSVRVVDILAPTKERPKMLIDIIAKIRVGQRL